MKIALVYDRVNKWGGAERVLLALHEIWPEAPLFTSVCDFREASWASSLKVIPSFLQNFPFARSNHEMYPLLMPMAFENFIFDQYDVVISVTSEAAKGIVTKPNCLHLCYCLTPTRYLWSGYGHYFNTDLKRSLNRLPVAYLRKWDRIAAMRPDEYIAISKTVQGRIKKYYDRESEIIYPPVNTEVFNLKSQISNLKSQSLKFYLVVSRLVKYKKVDMVIEAFNQLGWDLKIVGTGREMGNLRKKAGKNVEFLGQLTDEELIGYYQNCRAVIYAQEEDFGLVPLEAQACGKPIIAFSGGGALETVVEGKTGKFFSEQTTERLLRTLLQFERLGESYFKKQDCRKQAEKFSKERFKKEFKNLVEEKWQKHTKTTFMR